MAFANKLKDKFPENIIKSDIDKDTFESMIFEPVGNNDYWVYKSMDMQKAHLKKDPTGLELSPKIILYQSQTTESLTKIFGEPTLPLYNDYIYDIWVMEYKNIKFLIRQSFEGTTYDILIKEGVSIFNNEKIGLDIENIMNELLKVYIK